MTPKNAFLQSLGWVCTRTVFGLVTALTFGPFHVQAGVVEVWAQRYNGPANGGDRPYAIAVDLNGNVVVTGTSYNGTNNDFYTAKYAATNGAVLWERRYNGPVNGYEQARAVAVDSSGNVVVTGSSQSNSSYWDSFDYYTAKYAAADGALLWEKRYNGPSNGSDEAIRQSMPRQTAHCFGGSVTTARRARTTQKPLSLTAMATPW